MTDPRKPLRIQKYKDKRHPSPAPTYYCNSKRQGVDAYCRNRAGARTGHLGIGRCWKHGGTLTNVERTHGWSSKYVNKRIQDLKDEYEKNPDPLNIFPELALARALLHDFLDRYGRMRDALLAWHEARMNGSDAEAPDGKSVPMAPTKILDIADAHRQIEGITRIVERIEKMRNADAISKAELLNVLRGMARIVEMHISDEVILEKIKVGWSNIRLIA